MRTAHIFSLIFGPLVSANAFAASFAMAAIGEFGEPLTDCRVESFQSTGSIAKPARDYKERFRSLAASDIPDGEYIVRIRCRGAGIAAAHVHVSNFDRFEVVSENRRLSRSHPTPYLVIRLNSAPPRGETWWLTLRALYGKRSDTAEFQSDTGEALIPDPDPGSYLVSVLSSTGYNCLGEIDLVERTHMWTFNPTACTFGVDAFAHVVTEEDKREHKTTSWYQQLRKDEEDVWRALERMSKGAGDPNFGK